MNKKAINEFIDNLMDQTIHNKLKWKPAEEFFNDPSFKNSPAASELTLYSWSDWATLYTDDSFYLQKNGQYLFLLHTDLESGKDGSVTEIWGLYAILDLKDDMFETIPDYHPANAEDRIKKISSIIKKNIATEEAKKEKRLLAFFDSII